MILKQNKTKPKPKRKTKMEIFQDKQKTLGRYEWAKQKNK